MRFLSILFKLSIFFIFVGFFAVICVIYYYGKDLPDFKQLADYSPPTITRLYAADGKMLAEYAEEKRLFVPISAIPRRVINAFVAAEDKNFYSHHGIDFVSIVRAALTNLVNYGTNQSPVGGSTITQQVVKNFLLSNEKTLDRKIKEAILAFGISKEFSKEKIMELYLNQIYLGNRSYGVAAAALNYFNKSVGELTIEESALLAAMPKAPSSLDPVKYRERALERRNWVISRMEEENYITSEEALQAKLSDIKLVERENTSSVNAGFFADTVKAELINIYGVEAVNKEGLAVRTTLNSKLQEIAEKALLRGLVEYDRRHGWRGAIANINLHENFEEEFNNMYKPDNLGIWQMAIVTEINENFAKIHIYQKDREELNLKAEFNNIIPLKNLSWAQKFIDRNNVGEVVSHPNQVLKKGDVIAVQYISTDQVKNTNIFDLQQVPEINGAIIASDPHSGKIVAMVGGYYYGQSQFNRAVQAKRQSGSAFKPFVYLAALENGFAPNSIILDEAIQLDQGKDEQQWMPQNYSQKYYGPTTLRVGVEKSRNVMTVRLAQLIGIKKVTEIAERFDIVKNPQRNFSIALGAAETNLMALTNAYSMLVNGGKKISPVLIEKIQDNKGQIIYKKDERECPVCNYEEQPENLSDVPVAEENRRQITDPISAYQTVSILEGVIQRGTARKASTLNRTLAGKTGTTNDSFDGWFIGFTPDLTVGVYVGFDKPETLGKTEHGASAALPIWSYFMEEALKNIPDIPFRRPAGVKLVKIDVTTGLLPSATSKPENLIFEAFRAGTEPTSAANSLPVGKEGEISPDFGSGSIY